MPTLITRKPFAYANRRMKTGEEFEASNKDAKLLVAIGRAKWKPDPVVQLQSLPAPTEERAEDPKIETKAEEPRVKRAYNRRDMKAGE